MVLNIVQGRIQGGGGRRVRPPPLKLEKIWFFGVKSWFFYSKYPKIFAPPSARRNFFKCAPPNLKSWILPVVCSVMKYPVYTWNKVIRWHAAWQISFSGPPDTRGP